jgi:hypothetical protein
MRISEKYLGFHDCKMWKTPTKTLFLKVIKIQNERRKSKEGN